MSSCQDCGFNNSLFQVVGDHPCSVTNLCSEILVSHEIDRRSNFESEVVDGHSRQIENVEVFLDLWHAVVGKLSPSWNAKSAMRYVLGSTGNRSMIASLTALTSTLKGVRITRSLKYCRM
jgi:hypothetical protein